MSDRCKWAESTRYGQMLRSLALPLVSQGYWEDLGKEGEGEGEGEGEKREAIKTDDGTYRTYDSQSGSGGAAAMFVTDGASC